MASTAHQPNPASPNRTLLENDTAAPPHASVKPSTDNAPALAVDIEHGVKTFGERTLFADLTLQIKRNEFVALLGASGSGKTTLLRILLGLDTFDSGTGNVSAPRTAVFQEPRLVPSQRVWENVLMGQPRSKELQHLALTTLEEVGLKRHAQAWPATLSGGEAQRVALARALIGRPALLLLDEPFAALDALTRIRMHGLVKALVRRHRPGVLLVTHDVEEAIRLADRIVVLRDGHLTFNEQLRDSNVSDSARGSDLDPDSVANAHFRDPSHVAGSALRERLYRELGVVRDVTDVPSFSNTSTPTPTPVGSQATLFTPSARER